MQTLETHRSRGARVVLSLVLLWNATAASASLYGQQLSHRRLIKSDEEDSSVSISDTEDSSMDTMDDTTADPLGPVMRYIVTFKPNVTTQQDIEDICEGGKVPNWLQNDDSGPSVCTGILGDLGYSGSPFCKRKYNMLLLGIALELHQEEVLNVTLCLQPHVDSFQLDSFVELMHDEAYERGEDAHTEGIGRSRRLQQFQTSTGLSGEDASIVQMAESEVLWNLDRIDQELPTLDNEYVGLNIGQQQPWHASQSGVRIYVVDSGVMQSHTEFQYQASDGAWYSTVSYGPDYVDDDDISEDCEGHGSHVAGIAAGKNVGVAPGVKIVSVRVLDCKGSGSVSDVVAALDWIAQDMADAQAAYDADPASLPIPRGIVVMSLGITSGSWSKQMEDAVASLVILDNIPVVTAAGNSKGDTCKLAPANVEASTTVSATNLKNKLDPSLGMFDLQYVWANWGPCIDIYAPGVDIYSACANPMDACYPSNVNQTEKYKLSSGTSMAVPHVAGTMAMYLSVEPTTLAAEVKDLLIAKATIGQITDLSNGSPNKLLNTRLLNPPPPPSPPPSPPSPPPPHPPQLVLGGVQPAPQVSEPDMVAPEIVINGFVLAKYNKLPLNCPYMEKGAVVTDDADPDVQDKLQINTAQLDTSVAGTYQVWYSVQDSAGNTAKAHRSVQVMSAEKPCDSDVVVPILKTNGKQLAKYNTVEQCTDYIDPGAFAVATDEFDSDEELTAMIVTGGMPIDTSIVGNHKITYNLADSAGNAVPEKTRTVKVVASDKCPDTVKPEIKLKGKFLAKFNEIDQCSEWVDPGVTITDNVDSSATLQANLKTNLPLDTSSPGTYIVKFNVKDEAGNKALQKTRKVKVVAKANVSC